MKRVDQIDKNMAVKEISKEKVINWLPVTHSAIRLSGLPFYQYNRTFGRIPYDKKELFETVNPFINELGTNTAGAQVAFRSNTGRVYVKATTETVHNMVNMTPVGQCGFDCYAGKDRNHLKFIGISRFDARKQAYEVEIAEYPNNGEMVEYLINFPLYNGVLDFMVGIDENAAIELPTPFSQDGKLVFYGTSITQGGCASRPGMAYTNLIGRKLNMEVYNFGFSANGLGEYEMADLLAAIENPALYVLDYEANAGTNGRLEASLEGFITRLRKEHSQVPILVLSRLPYIFDDLVPEFGKRRNELRQFQKDTVAKLRENGDQQIYFCDGSKLWGDDYDEYTVDIIHPTDLGFYMMVQNLIPVIRGILQ